MADQTGQTKVSALEKTFALVTGASQGLGKAFSEALAQRGYHLLLAALPGEDVFGLAQRLSRLGISVHAYEADLSDPEELRQFADWVNGRFRVALLINNAGRGGTRPFGAAPAAYLDGILQLNIRATVLLTHQLLPNLQQAPQAFILNVASMAAFSPIGYKTVYPASKGFLLQFSLGLREELRTTGVSVSVVCPGPMRTNTDATQRIDKQGFKGKIGLLSPAQVAEAALAGLFRRQAVIVPGFVNRFNRIVLRLLPTKFATKLLTKAIRTEVDVG